MWLSVPEKELNVRIGACRWVGACKTDPTDHRRCPSPEDGAGQVRATDLDQLRDDLGPDDEPVRTGEVGEQPGAPAGAGADVENPLPRPYVEQPQHVRDRTGL